MGRRMTVVTWLSKLPMDIINQNAKRYGVEASLIAAICKQESNCNPFAERFEPAFRWIIGASDYAKAIGSSVDTETNGQKKSYGLMQIMGSVAREQGFKGWFGELFDPDLNIEYGTRHLSKFLQKHSDISLAVSAYNAGAPKRLPNGNLVNQSYVNSVLIWKSEADARTSQ